jgi:hypothetical protein
LLGLKEEARAEWHYLRAIKVAPNHTGALFKYAIFLKNPLRNRILEADEYFKKCLTINPSNTGCFQAYRNTLKHHGRTIPELAARTEEFVKKMIENGANYKNTDYNALLKLVRKKERPINKSV